MLQLQTRLTNFGDIKTFDRAGEKFNNSSLVKWPIWVKFQFNSLQLFSQIIFVWLKISCQWQSNKQFKYLDQLQNIQMNIFRAAHNRYWKSIFAADMFVKCWKMLKNAVFSLDNQYESEKEEDSAKIFLSGSMKKNMFHYLNLFKNKKSTYF